MDVQHHVGPRARQVFVTALQRRAAEIRGREIPLLQHGAHGPVEDEDTAFQDLLERTLALLGCGHKEAISILSSRGGFPESSS